MLTVLKYVKKRSGKIKTKLTGMRREERVVVYLSRYVIFFNECNMDVYFVYNKIVFTELVESILSFTLKLSRVLGDLLYQVR